MNYSTIKFFLAMACVLTAMALTAQQTDTTAKHSYAKTQYLHYMKQRSTHLTAGWVMVGIGVALPVSWFLMNSANGWNGPAKGEGMVEAGIGAVVLSTPFFIMAGSNRRKAKLALKGEPLISAIIPRRSFYAALSVSLDL